MNAAQRLQHLLEEGRTHLDLDVSAVDDLHDADHIVKHQAHLLTVICKFRMGRLTQDFILKNKRTYEGSSGLSFYISK